MKQYRVEAYRKALEDIFDERNTKIVLGWMISNEARPPVVVVGAGFTRNAQRKGRGGPVRTTEIPLWIDVIKRLAGDIGVQVGWYDAPMLAELYTKEMGLGTLYNTLSNMIADDQLEPGEAHRALFDYPVEAVITTNQLDTVLDQNGRGWLRVVDDPDMAVYRPGGTRNVQLIYFHGHRQNRGSWVFTRSQYEDIPKDKPVILTRVRQLLSQFPVLIVGYSLSDPDFHHIYRQLKTEMKSHQPLGLAILLDEPPPAERRHWEGLGIRLAVLKDSGALKRSPERCSHVLGKFFGISPNLRVGFEEMKQYITKRRPLEARIEWTRNILEDAERYVFIDIGSRDRSDADFILWSASLFSELDSGEQEEAQRRRLEGVRSPSHGRTEESSSPPKLSYLPADRFNAEHKPCWEVEILLSSRRDRWPVIAQWLLFALERGLFHTERAEDDFFSWLVFASWLWTELAKRESAGDAHVKESRAAAERVVRECYRQAVKYGDDGAAKLIQKDAQGLDIELTQDATAESELLQAMKRGFDAVMNADFDAGREAYRRAAEIAQRDADPFSEWLALSGELHCHNAASQRRRERAKNAGPDAAVDAALRTYRERIKQLHEGQVVKAWLEAAKTRREALQKHELDRLKAQEEERRSARSTTFFNSAPHFFWRSFRDLETRHAPPQLQHEYLKPLVEFGEFALEDELAYRLRFDIADTDRWLQRAADTSRDSVEAQASLDAKLMDEVTREPATITERLSRLKAIRGARHLLRREDVPWLRRFFLETRSTFGEAVSNYRQDSLLGSVYPRVLRVYASVAEPSDALSLYRDYLESLVGPVRRQTLGEELTDLPWYSWIALNSSVADVLLDFVLDVASATDEAKQLGRAHARLAWSIYTIVDGARELNPTAVAGERRARVLSWTSKVMALDDKNGYAWEALRGAFLTELALAAPNAREGVVRRWLERTATRLPTKVHDNSSELRQSILADWLQYGEAGDPVRPYLEAEWAALDSRWEKIEALLKSNPEFSDPYARFLAHLLASNEAPPESVRARLLSLVRNVPGVLKHVAVAMRPSLWGSRWGDLVDQVLASAGGNRGDNTLVHEIAAVDVWWDWLRKGEREPRVREALMPVFGAALLAISDERTVLANHASLAVMQYAEVTDRRADADRCAAALRRIARDSRAALRFTAAYGAARLRRLATSAVIREAADEVYRQLEADANALVQVQRALGEREAEIKLSKPKADGKRPPAGNASALKKPKSPRKRS